MPESHGSSDPTTLGMRLYGSNVTEEAAREAAQHMVGALDAVGDAMGYGGKIRWKVGPVRWVCDGCDRERTPDAFGWVKGHGGTDFCPDCAFGAWCEA